MSITINCKGMASVQSHLEGYSAVTLSEVHPSTTNKMIVWLIEKIGYRKLLDQFDRETIEEYLEEEKVA